MAQGGQPNDCITVGALLMHSLKRGGDETFLMWWTRGAAGDAPDRATVIRRLHDVVLLAVPQAEGLELAGVAVAVRPCLEEQALAVPVDSSDEG